MSKMESIKPTLHLTVKDLPVIKDWKIGKTYQFTLQVKLTSMSQHRDMPMEAGFEVQSVKSGSAELTKDQKAWKHKMSLDMD